MKKRTLLFGAQFLSYFLIVANTRAYTQGRYVWTAVTDTAIALIGFYTMKWISEGEDNRLATAMFYAMGGMLGSLVSIWVTKLVY